MTSAEIITIGTELLLGDILDTNTSFLAQELNKIGIDIFRTITVGDNHTRITRQIRQSLENADIVITTGGLGPTVDDPTREAVADVFGVPLVFSEDLWTQIQNRFERFHRTPTENNRKQAYLPSGAIPIENPVGTAPAFFVENSGRMLICLPGVPAEAKYLFQHAVVAIIRDTFNVQLTTITRIIRTAGMGESAVDSLIHDFEKLHNPTVGVTAHPGQVDIRITAKAADAESALAIITPVETQITTLLNGYVFGFDGDTLINVVIDMLQRNGLTMQLKYPAELASRISQLKLTDVFNSQEPMARKIFLALLSGPSKYNRISPDTIVILLDGEQGEENRLSMTLINENNFISKKIFFGGHPDLFSQWIENQILDSTRVYLQKKVK
jgi:competence/damage-inducible protein CinA-like protein